MVARHGVRAPIRPVALLDSLTRRGWPAWPVGPGAMTPHGAKTLGLMADWLHAIYANAGALPTQGCPAPGTVAVWADEADHRTRQSGDIFAERLAPGCGIVSRFAAQADPLFDATKSKACRIGPIGAAAATLRAARTPDLLQPQDKAALAALQAILAPDACRGGSGICLVPGPDAAQARSVADMRLGGVIAEGLYLEYVEGMTLADVGWGGVKGPETIDAIMPVRERDMDVLRRDPTLAARRGALMARAIVALLTGGAAPEGSALAKDARVTMIAGHDSNLLYLAALMGLDWTLPGQPSLTAPDTTLAFEVRHDPAGGARSVRVKVYAQTLAQLREAIPLDAGHRPIEVAVVPEACRAGADCPLDIFAADIDRRLAAICGR